MKDLYRKLGIEPEASATEVAEALERNLLLSDATSILLDKNRREVYDEVHAALRAIGIMRYQLGLDKDDSWFMQNYSDFVPRLSIYKPPVVSQAPEENISVRQTKPDATPLRRPKNMQQERSNTPVIVAVIAVAIVLVVLAINYF